MYKLKLFFLKKKIKRIFMGSRQTKITSHFFKAETNTLSFKPWYDVIFFNNQKWNLYINKEGAHPSTNSAKELPNNYKRIVLTKDR